MDNRDLQVLNKICKHIVSVIEYCKNCHSLEDFESDPMRVEACVFNLLQIGELAKQGLSEEIKEQNKNIPWKQLYGLRNRIVHGYSGIDMSIVWDSIANDLPDLLADLKEITE